MKRVFICLLTACFIFTGCSSGSREKDKRIAAQVNKYKMTAEDLKYELENVPYDNAGLLGTEEGRRKYVDALIEKEILLQEAQRQGLDREQEFMRSIENYWEQSLLKLLLERKSKEISGLIHVYDNEINKYYKDSNETLPLSRLRKDIEKEIRQQKETEAMNLWIEELRKKSSIKINKEVLEKVFSEQ